MVFWRPLKKSQPKNHEQKLPLLTTKREIQCIQSIDLPGLSFEALKDCSGIMTAEAKSIAKCHFDILFLCLVKGQV